MLVPVDYPARLADRGVAVNVYAGWESHGSGADHGAVVIHHTASGATVTPKGDADYCHSHADAAPLYNVMIDRYGAAWILAREKSNNAGNVSGVALNEALDGKATLTPAAVRDLADTTSDNASLFGVSAQNNGSGEPWSDALVRGIGIACAVACETLGLGIGHVTTHRALTARKIDPDGGNCPDDWHSIVGHYLNGGDMPTGAQMMGVHPDGSGYWIVGSDGGVFAYDVPFYGSMGGEQLNAPVVGITVTPSGRGYWLLAQDGGVFSFGDAAFHGAPTGDIR